MVNSLSPDHSFFRATILLSYISKLCISTYRVQLKKTLCRQECVITFSSGSTSLRHYCYHVGSFHPTRLPKPCYKDGSFLCCLQGAVCQRNHHWPLHCFNNHGRGRRYGGNMWASASVAPSSLCPFTCAFSLRGPDGFCFFLFLFCQTANLYKVIIWTNSKLMSFTSSQRVVKLSSLTSFLVMHCTYV